jgi:dipeptidyl aminopeptidase/acylaminoacyl peptidase
VAKYVEDSLTRRLSSLLLLLFCSSLLASAGDLDHLIDTVFATHQFKEVAISADGSEVAWVEQWPLNNLRYQNHIFIAATKSGVPIPVKAARSEDDHGLTWSPDGEHLAFLADETNQGEFQLHVFDLRTKEVKVVGPIGDLSTPRWSPKGDEIAVLLKAAPQPAENVVGLWIHRDTVPATLVLVNSATGELRHIGPADLNLYEYDWSPDGKHLAATGAIGDANDNWWHARLFRIDLADNKTTALLTPPTQIASPTWAPDGKSIAFLGGLMSDFIAPGGEVFVIPAEGGEAVDLTPGLLGSATGLSWRQQERVLFSEDIDGETAVGSISILQKAVETVWRGEDNISTGGLVSGIAFASNGSTSALVRQSFAQAPEVWAGEVGQWHQLSHVNSTLKPAWGDAKSVHWQNQSQRVQGWLLFPKDYHPENKYPMIVLVHGGPAGDSASKWAKPFYDVEVFSGLGYFVFYPNARGSLGFGEAFTQANVKDLGYGDFRDITSGVEDLVSKLPIDRNRVGITGWSYGGYMAMWAGTQTDLFKASVAGPGVSNWQSYYGQVDIENWLIPYFGASVYDNPEIYNRSSPINFISKAKTPTMMYAGTVDTVCPVSQSYELWRGLAHMSMPTDLVIYPGETHGLVIPKNQRAVTEAAFAWFQKYLPRTQ